MKEFFDKISSYNIFNYLLPGILFVIIAKKITAYNFFVPGDILIGAFFYYFLGMVISRVGSILIEPILKKLSFIKFSDYKEFIAASKKDEKIEVLSEANNTYRSIISMIVLLLGLKLYSFFQVKYAISQTKSLDVMLVLLLIMFLFAYRKQTNYITKRIKANN